MRTEHRGFDGSKSWSTRAPPPPNDAVWLMTCMDVTMACEFEGGEWIGGNDGRWRIRDGKIPFGVGRIIFPSVDTAGDWPITMLMLMLKLKGYRPLHTVPYTRLLALHHDSWNGYLIIPIVVSLAIDGLRPAIRPSDQEPCSAMKQDTSEHRHLMTFLFSRSALRNSPGCSGRPIKEIPIGIYVISRYVS